MCFVRQISYSGRSPLHQNAHRRWSVRRDTVQFLYHFVIDCGNRRRFFYIRSPRGDKQKINLRTKTIKESTKIQLALLTKASINGIGQQQKKRYIRGQKTILQS